MRAPTTLVWAGHGTGPDQEALIGERFSCSYPQDQGKDLGVAMPGGWRRTRVWGWGISASGRTSFSADR